MNRASDLQCHDHKAQEVMNYCQMQWLAILLIVANLCFLEVVVGPVCVDLHNVLLTAVRRHLGAGHVTCIRPGNYDTITLSLCHSVYK